jgi:signal peptidase II
MKLRFAALTVLLIIIADQALKIWIKTTFPFGHVMDIMGIRWAKLYFIENAGMAWGWNFGGEWGKVVLTLFRLVAVLFGTWYLIKVIREKYSRGFIMCACLIYAGALGNLIDSMFYGMMFEESSYVHVAKMFPPKGYAGFLHGRVVDMLYFPMVHSTFPSWMPGIGGKDFEFFSPIFNIADASISAGVITLLIFQKRFFRKEEDEEVQPAVESTSEISDQAHVV